MQPIPLGTRVDVKMFMNPRVVIFLVVFVAFTGYHALTDPSVMLALMAVYMLVIFTGGFIAEVNKAKRLLMEALSGKLLPLGH